MDHGPACVVDAETRESMKQLFAGLYYKLKIKALLIFSPVTLFNKISQLSWYSDTLHSWIDLHASAGLVHALDVGCASGYLCEYLHRSGHLASGVDVSKSMISAARIQNPNIDFHLANAYELPYADEVFDVVSSASLINIVSDPARLIEEMLRVCRQGGWITFLFPVAGFETDALYKYIAISGISGFSKAALMTWHESAPKISIESINLILKENKLHALVPKLYIDGMVASVSTRKNITD